MGLRANDTGDEEGLKVRMYRYADLQMCGYANVQMDFSIAIKLTIRRDICKRPATTLNIAGLF
jgi:hypothetical protein